MDGFLEICQKIVDNQELIIKTIGALGVIITSCIGTCSLVIKAIPILKKGNKALPVVKLIGKLAFNKTVKDKDRPG